MTEQTVGWALHALEPDEEIAAIEHMASCAECRRAAEDVAEVTTGLATAVEQRDPPPRLRASIMEIAEQTPQVPVSRAEPSRVEPESGREPAPSRRARGGNGPVRPGADRPPATARPRRRGRTLVAAAAMLAVLAGGGVIVGYAQQMRSERDASVAQAQSIFDTVARFDRPGTTHAFLAPTTPNAQPVAAVMVNGAQRTVISVDLKPNSVDHQTYVLWGLNDPTRPKAVGTFDVHSAAGSPISVGSATGGSFGTYAISLENGREAPASPSAVLAMGRVET